MSQGTASAQGCCKKTGLSALSLKVAQAEGTSLKRGLLGLARPALNGFLSAFGLRGFEMVWVGESSFKMHLPEGKKGQRLLHSAMYLPLLSL